MCGEAAADETALEKNSAFWQFGRAEWLPANNHLSLLCITQRSYEDVANDF